MSRFRDTGIWIRGVNNPTEEQLINQEKTYQTCKENPQACANDLERVCGIYSRKDLENRDILKFCGCYLKDENYRIERECDSVCTNINAIPYSRDGRTLNCTRDVCVIDNISINIKNSTTRNITFNQLCENCTGGNCLCIIGSKLPGSINQNCTSSVCYDGNEEVDCSQFISLSNKENFMYQILFFMSFLGMCLGLIFLINQ